MRSSYLTLVILVVLGWTVCNAEMTPEEAAPLARQLVKNSKLGFLSTLMRPLAGPLVDVQGFPFASPEYLADTCPSSGEPLVMLVSWGTHAQNAKLDSRASFTVRDMSWITGNGTEWARKGGSLTKDRGTMDHARVILIGRLVRVPTNEVPAARQCFLNWHPDADDWLDAHHFLIFQFQVKEVVWIGGFGDEHYVGHIPLNEYLDASSSVLPKNSRGSRLFHLQSRP